MKVITAEQYRRLMGLGEEPSEEAIIEILVGKPKSKMTIKEIQSLDLDDFKMPEATLFPNVIRHKGVLYGKQDFQNMTFGLYIDLVEQAKDIQENLIALMTMIWRPVTKVSYWNRTKAYAANRMLSSRFQFFRRSGLRILARVKYSIEDYDPLKCTLREKEFKEMNGSLAAYTTTFFLTTSEVLMLNSLRSLKDKLQIQGDLLQESLKKILADGDGSPTSGSLQEKEQSK